MYNNVYARYKEQSLSEQLCIAHSLKKKLNISSTQVLINGKLIDIYFLLILKVLKYLKGRSFSLIWKNNFWLNFILYSLWDLNLLEYMAEYIVNIYMPYKCFKYMYMFIYL